MINITKLWCGTAGSMDQLRYGAETHQKPVVVWNTTRRCNLRCVHCYSQSENKLYPNELTTNEAKAFVADLAAFGVKVLLFSGGEPLLRQDLFEVARFASDRGLRPVLSTNGTLITEDVAGQLKNAGFSYIGISLDGIGETNDKFRGKKGAYELAVNGIRTCLKAEVKTGLRFTVTNYNLKDLPEIFSLIETEGIPRVCLYHLAYVGRGTNISNDDLTHNRKRELMDYLFSVAESFHQKNLNTEILTVDNHADAAYLYLELQKKDPKKAEDALRLLQINGGNSSGTGIACVDSAGYVHPDQFWQHYSLDNIRNRKFSEIWSDNSEPLLHGLRNRKIHLYGRCAECRFLEICNGNLRVRAEAVYGDIWASDPACYLTYEETKLN